MYCSSTFALDTVELNLTRGCNTFDMHAYMRNMLYAAIVSDTKVKYTVGGLNYNVV